MDGAIIKIEILALAILGCWMVFAQMAFAQAELASLASELYVVVATQSDDDIVKAVAQIKSAGGGTLYFPPGRYEISRDVKSRTYLYFEDVKNLKITGAGADKTELVLAQDELFRGQNTRLIVVDGYERLEVSNLRMTGQRKWMNPKEVPTIGQEEWSKANAGSTAEQWYHAAEQQSAIFIRDGNQQNSSTYVHDNVFRHHGGDAVNMADVANVVVARNDIDDMGRNGVTIGGVLGEERSDNVLIENNLFGPNIDTQLVDIELHGSLRDDPKGYRDANRNADVSVVGNTAKLQVPNDTIDNDQFFMDIHGTNGVLLQDNDLGNNPLSGSYCRNVVIRENKGIGGGRFFRNFDVLLIRNEINLSPKTRENWTTHKAGFTFTEAAGLGIESISLVENTITSSGVQFPIRIHNAAKINLIRNRFEVDDAGKDTIVLVEADRRDSVLNTFGNVGLNDKIQTSESRYTIVQTSSDSIELPEDSP